MKVALITGGSRGIGKSAALHVAQRGNAVVLTYNNHLEEGKAVEEEIRQGGGRAIALPLNVSSLGSIMDFAGKLESSLQEEWGVRRIDYLVNNAAVGIRSAIASTTEEVFDQLLNTNLKGPYFLTQKLLPLMNDGGHILNVSSISTRHISPGSAPYAAMKGALNVFTVYLANELGPRRIRANIVAPGTLDTDFGGGKDDDMKKHFADATPLGRIGNADDIGLLIASLLSEDSRFVTGALIEASGGL